MTTARCRLPSTHAASVIGACVHDQLGRRVGKIDDVVIDNESTDIVFAVVGFGGFRGMPETYYPIPWESLTYDEQKAAYVGTFTRRQLEAPPAGWD